jgi:secreted trypsin-like serine protease
MKAQVILVLAMVAIAHAFLKLPLPEELKAKHPDWRSWTPNPRSRVVGGTPVQSGGRPFQILLARSGSFTCGGSLIASNKVLTAAHCVYGNENSPTLYTVRYNTLTQTGGQVITVSKISRHAQYNPNTIDYDYAVLTLAQAFTPATNAQLVTIATSEAAHQAPSVASGFGRTVGGGAVSQNLLQTDLNIVGQSQCQSAMGSINTITARMNCANASGKGVCNGDSGGPLTVNGQQVGIASWVVSGCLTTYPSVFANAVNGRSWILAQ